MLLYMKGYILNYFLKMNIYMNFTERTDSPEWTFVLLKRLMNEHVSLHFVLPVEGGLTD